MKVLIVENEIYLAQSIATKLSDIGYLCEIHSNLSLNFNANFYDIVLLSTSLESSFVYKIIERFKDSIIILLIAYISNDTVSNPIEAGASDYIQKPFMIEELIRKIKHFENFRLYKNQAEVYGAYIDNQLQALKLPAYDVRKLKFPLMLRTLNSVYADKFVFELSKELNVFYKHITLNTTMNYEKIIRENLNSNLYISNIQILKENEKEKLFALIEKKNFILASNDLNQNSPFETLNIATNEKSFNSNEILSINDYIKLIINNYQAMFSDTELSKKLGISRKSLWEKRKKYGINKKK